MKEKIKNLIRDSIEAAQLMPPDDLADIQLEISRTKNPDHGHFSCNIALRLSKKLGLNAVDLAIKFLTTLIKQKALGRLQWPHRDL